MEILAPYRYADRDLRDRRTRYATSERGEAKISERARRKNVMMTKPFCAWDGEGITVSDGSHKYVLLANSLKTSIVSEGGLSTEHIFETLLNSDLTKSHIHIGYGIGYDINMWLKDLNRETLEVIYQHGKVNWNGYHLEWRQGKCFTVVTRERSFTIYDVLPFFQRSFIQACDEYLGTDWLDRDLIITEKKNRNAFTFDQITNIGEYNDAELTNLVLLSESLRARLDSVNIHVNRWDGPGAIASFLYKKHKTKQAINKVPNKVAEAGRNAYAGGRFEIIRKGHSPYPVYQYDLRSAYPAAMRLLPCLSCGTWKHILNPTRIVPYGIYRINIESALAHESQPQPLWHRNKNGTVYFSKYPHNWYWSPEASLVNVTPDEGWEYETKCAHDPFAFVQEIYDARAILKRNNDGGHVAYKLGLNSLYGKLAQQIGWELGPPLKLPPYHCLEWAGWITAHCRAEVYKASLHAPNDVIAFETDAIFSRVPLPLTLGEGLGEWEETRYQSFTYLKSGMYWATKLDGTEIEKTRGVNKGSIQRGDVIHALHNDLPHLYAEQTRFITLGQALHQNFAIWTHWITGPRVITTALNGKRIDSTGSEHAGIPDGLTETQEGFHETLGMSYPYTVEWIDGIAENPYDVADLRTLDNDSQWMIDYD